MLKWKPCPLSMDFANKKRLAPHSFPETEIHIPAPFPPGRIPLLAEKQRSQGIPRPSPHSGITALSPHFPQQSRYIPLGLRLLNPCTKLKRLAVRLPHYNLV